MIQNTNRFTSLIVKGQLAPPWFTYTFDRLTKNFGVNLLLTILFTILLTVCKMGICLWVTDFWFGTGISGGVPPLLGIDVPCLKIYRVRQLMYTAYVPTPTFIDIWMILGMCTLTCMLNFSLWFFKVFKIFLILICLYCLICLSLEETDSLLFKFVLKKPYFSIFDTNYVINISPYFRLLANLGGVSKKIS